MNLQITLDMWLIGRCLAGLGWGIFLAGFMQFHRVGMFITKERTWLMVVVGVGGDLALGIGGDWLAVTAVVGMSSVGIIVRALVNESRIEPDLRSYKHKWAVEESIDLLGEVIGQLEATLTAGVGDARVSKALGAAHAAQHKLTLARYGDLAARKH